MPLSFTWGQYQKHCKMTIGNHYDKKYFIQRDHLDLLMAETLANFAKERKIKRILDVGCGTGRLVKYLNEKGFETIGLDPEKEAIKIAKKLNGSKKIIQASAGKLPVKKNSFGLVSAISVIEHLNKKDAENFIKEAKKVLVNGGYIFLITPNYNSPFRFLLGKKWFAFSDPSHINFFSANTLTSLLKKNGFKNITFKFEAAKNIKFYWHLPPAIGSLPQPAIDLVNYLLITSPLAIYRDSLWVCAQK